MLYTSSTLAVLGLATLARSHMIMNTPVPFGKSTLDNSPLINDGSNFPCKQRTGVYAAEGASNTMALGSSQTLSFTGSATHGGGSCQVSITYDQAPTKSSTWKVIHSIEGGCPIRNTAGNTGESANAVDPDTYNFTIPTTLPTGTAVLAWTWFNKVGNREMYMNCAPITLTATSSKRSDEDELMTRNITQLMIRDTAAYDALPDMFVANIPVTECTTVDSHDVQFPNPGESLEQNGLSTSALIGPSGTACGKTVAATGGASGSSATTAATASPATTAASSAGGVFITNPTSQATSAAQAGTTTAGVSGGVFATIPTSQATSAPVASSVPAASATSSATATTLLTSSAAPASTGSASGTTGAGSAITAGTACTTEGEWNCIGGTSYQQCASGAWSVVMPLAAGTECTAGESTNINITAGRKNKRSVRFSGSHLRRHLQKS